MFGRVGQGNWGESGEEQINFRAVGGRWGDIREGNVALDELWGFTKGH